MAKQVCVAENDMTKCTGCMVCVDACPANAIKESFTKDGFRIPNVQGDKCVKCGRCMRVCSLNAEKKLFKPISVYRMAADDNQIRVHCSSGGVFALLAEKTIECGGMVVGAVYDAESKEIRHLSSDEVGLEHIYRSKYAQSNMIGIYQKTAEALKTGRNVLFCGTPCQVRALSNYLDGRKQSGNLLTVDFMCHGVPSTMQFKDFILEREKKEHSPVVNVTFREKDDGWRTQVIKTYHENGRVWKKTSYYYYYYYMFLNNYSLRDSCYSCEEYNTHTADITLADDWNCSENDNLGTSLVFVNSLSGQSAIYSVLDKATYTDVTQQSMDNIAIYSHSGYDYRKKEQWKKALETGGYRKVKTILFYKASMIPLAKYKLRRQASMIKKMIKKIWGGVNSRSIAVAASCLTFYNRNLIVYSNVNTEYSKGYHLYLRVALGKPSVA